MRSWHLLPILTGARSDDRSWSLEIAAVTVRHALRRAGAQDGRELAVALLTVDRLLGPTDGRAPVERRTTTAEALATVPTAAAWAEDFTRAMGPPRHVRGLTRGMVDASLTTLSASSDADDALVAMLTDAVLTCQDLAAAGAASACVPSMAGAQGWPEPHELVGAPGGGSWSRPATTLHAAT